MLAQSQLTLCKAEHDSQLKTARFEAHAQLRPFEAEAERRREEAMTFRLKHPESVHSQILSALQDAIAKHEVMNHELAAKADDLEARRKAMTWNMLECTKVGTAWEVRCKKVQDTIRRHSGNSESCVGHAPLTRLRKTFGTLEAELTSTKLELSNTAAVGRSRRDPSKQTVVRGSLLGRSRVRGGQPHWTESMSYALHDACVLAGLAHGDVA